MGFLNVLGDLLSTAMRQQKQREDSVRRKYDRNYSSSSSSSSNSSSSSRSSSSSASYSSSTSSSKHRGTKEEFRSDMTGMDRSPSSYSIGKRIPLRRAINQAPSEEGVYIIWLHGEVMKCGVATYGQGLHWRFTQYYNLNYDDRARKGDYWSISPDNRDDVEVSWQACPKRVCDEMEYKLFQKYGKGPWAKRAPSKLATDEWTLLI